MFEDAESYVSGKESNLSFREIVLMHLRKITLLACCEFRGGYTFEKQYISGGISRSENFYQPDTRELYINAIEMLHDLLLPLFDKKMKEAIEKLDNEYKESKEGKESKVEKKNFRLEYKRKLFQQLSLLLNRLKYLEGKSFGEEV